MNNKTLINTRTSIKLIHKIIKKQKVQKSVAKMTYDFVTIQVKFIDLSEKYLSYRNKYLTFQSEFNLLESNTKESYHGLKIMENSVINMNKSFKCIVDIEKLFENTFDEKTTTVKDLPKYESKYAKIADTVDTQLTKISDLLATRQYIELENYLISIKDILI